MPTSEGVSLSVPTSGARRAQRADKRRPKAGACQMKDSPGEDGENRRVRLDYTPRRKSGRKQGRKIYDRSGTGREDVVSEGGLEPPPPYRGLGPQPSASTNSATPTGQPAEYTRDA